MQLSQDPREVAEQILERSICHVKVGAVLADNWGIHAWSWNHIGNGFGEHAEAYCFKRANRNRIKDSTLYIAAVRKRNGKIVTAKPCDQCLALTWQCKSVVYRDRDGEWRRL